MDLAKLSQRIVECRQCPRLVKWREQVARERRRAYENEDYWGRPVSGFGDPKARLLIVGLAPGAHGANRTGRIFTGDRSGDWLYRALFRAGFANQAESIHRGDGLRLKDAYVTAIVRCAPPGNRPTPVERDRCLPYLIEEIRLLARIRVIVALGSFAWEGVFRTFRSASTSMKSQPKFGHRAHAVLGRYHILGSYHPSQQNTFTRRLTEAMLDDVFSMARGLLKTPIER
jgi:uracil-DNA glycosylase